MRKHTEATGSLTPAGLQLAGQQLPDLIHPRCFNLGSWRLSQKRDGSQCSEKHNTVSTKHSQGPRNQGTLYMEQEQVWECPFGGSPGSTGLAAEGHGFVQESRAQQRQPVTNREAISSADAGVLG